MAVNIAQQLELPVEPFFGANLCYATPLAHKINVLIMSAGGYTFSDYARVGVPLLIIMRLAYSGCCRSSTESEPKYRNC